MNWEDRFADRVGLMQQSTVREFLKYAAQPGMISFAGGLPDPRFLPVDETRIATERALSKHGAPMLQYGTTEGVPDLRDFIAARFRKLGATAENVLITTGSQQALDLIGRVLLNEGSTVAVQNPTYLAALSTWRPYGPRFVAGHGESPLPESRVPHLDLIYCIPNFLNPTGESLNVENRSGLVHYSVQNAIPLLEDDPYGELRYESTAALPSLIEISENLTGPVIHVGTFSKILAPGFRIGWIVAGRDLITKLAVAKQALDLHTSTFAQYAVLELLHMGAIEKLLPRLRAAYADKCSLVVRSLQEQMPATVRWSTPKGGFFLLLSLPQSIEGRSVAACALKANVAIVPGGEFHVQGGHSTLRLCFSYLPEKVIPEGLGRLAQVIRSLTP